MKDRFETDRLILRRFGEGDIMALHALLSDAEVNRFLPWFPSESPEETRRFYEERFRDSEFAFAVCLKSDGIPIGYIKADTDEARDFGYALRKEFWGRGIMTEAGKTLVGVLRDAGFPYITATHDVKNPASGGVMRNIGMRYRYTYKEQWQPKDIPVFFRMYQLNFDGSDFVYRKYWDMYDERFVDEKFVDEKSVDEI